MLLCKTVYKAESLIRPLSSHLNLWFKVKGRTAPAECTRLFKTNSDFRLAWRCFNRYSSVMDAFSAQAGISQ